jgi:hypothetical protein
MSIIDDYQIHLRKVLKSFDDNIYNPYDISAKKYQLKVMGMNNQVVEMSNKPLSYTDYEKIRKIAISDGGFMTLSYRKKFYLKRSEKVTHCPQKSNLDSKTIETIYKDVERSLINGFGFLKDSEK